MGVNSFPEGGSPVADGQHMSASDPESYWRPLRPGETVYVLQDIVQGPVVPQDVSPVMTEQGTRIISKTAEKVVREQVAKIVERIISETTEKMVRDLAPEIVERVIREEIEKLKRANH
jgi:uncharacterized protein (UPF0147 family)